jgi:NTP pyrophosphatase (non-canonical NTP hydrolase)
MRNHVEGELCEYCAEILEDEIGRTLFYLAALCNVLGLNLSEILQKEKERVTCLGIFNFS